MVAVGCVVGRQGALPTPGTIRKVLLSYIFAIGVCFSSAVGDLTVRPFVPEEVMMRNRKHVGGGVARRGVFSTRARVRCVSLAPVVGDNCIVIVLIAERLVRFPLV